MAKKKAYIRHKQDKQTIRLQTLRPNIPHFYACPCNVRISVYPFINACGMIHFPAGMEIENN